MTFPMPQAPEEWPASNDDFNFYYEGLRCHTLLIQRCDACHTPRFPPGPMCGSCGSLDWRPHVCSGRGTIFSYTIQHRPAVPPYEHPHAMALVTLEEGVRMVLSFAGESLRIGLPTAIAFVQGPTGVILPVACAVTA